MVLSNTVRGRPHQKMFLGFSFDDPRRQESTSSRRYASSYWEMALTAQVSTRVIHSFNILPALSVVTPVHLKEKPIKRT